MTSTVALVLDRHFEARLAGLAKTMPVWIVSSEENNVAVEEACQFLGSAANITMLLAGGAETPGDLCLRGLYAIDEHHGESSSATPYERVTVFGASPDMLTPQAMEELDLASVAKSDFGFSAEKLPRQAAAPHSS